MQVEGLDLYLNPTEAEVARMLGLQLEQTSAGSFYRLFICSDIEQRESLIRNIMEGVDAIVESECRQKWNIEEAKMSDYMLLEDVETEWPGFRSRRDNMIDWQERVFQVLVDPDSAEIDAAMTQLFGALHDRDSAWHTQAVQVLRQLYEHFSDDSRADIFFDEDFGGHESRQDWPVRTLPSASPRMGAGAYQRSVGL